MIATGSINSSRYQGGNSWQSFTSTTTAAPTRRRWQHDHHQHPGVERALDRSLGVPLQVIPFRASTERKRPAGAGLFMPTKGIDALVGEVCHHGDGRPADDDANPDVPVARVEEVG